MLKCFIALAVVANSQAAYTTRPAKYNEMWLEPKLTTPPLKKAKKQGEMPFPSLGPIPSLNSLTFPHSDKT